MSTLGLRLLSRDQIFDTINRGRVNATTLVVTLYWRHLRQTFNQLIGPRQRHGANNMDNFLPWRKI